MKTPDSARAKPGGLALRRWGYLCSSLVRLKAISCTLLPGAQLEQAPSALHMGFLPSFGVRTLSDGEEFFHRAPQLTKNGGEQQLANIHATPQKVPWYLPVLVWTRPDSTLQEVFNVTNEPREMAHFTRPSG